MPVRAGETPSALAARLARAEPAAADSARRFARMVNSHYYTRDSIRERREELRRMRRLLTTLKRQLRRARSGSGPMGGRRTPSKDGT